MALFRKGIRDNAKDFYDGKQYELAQVYVLRYLIRFFKQVLEGPEFKKGKFKKDFHRTLAIQVGGYLLGKDMTSLEDLNLEKVDIDEVKLARKHMVKWADDTMNMDENFCELVIQTLRMHSVFQQFLTSDKWPFENPEGKRIFDITIKYGDKVPNAPDPKSYNKLLKKWMIWNDQFKDK